MSVVVIALIILAGAGFGLYATKQPATVTTTEVMISSVMATTTEVMTTPEAIMEPTPAVAFIPASNVMMAEGIHDAYLIVAPLGNGSYSVEIHAEGLEPTVGTGNIYIVEGQLKAGMMDSTSMIAQSAQASEFNVGSDGVGQYFTVIRMDPANSFDNLQLVFLGGMSTGNATAVATATF